VETIKKFKEMGFFYFAFLATPSRFPQKNRQAAKLYKFFSNDYLVIKTAATCWQQSNKFRYNLDTSIIMAHKNISPSIQ
jgi:hypothetical protein